MSFIDILFPLNLGPLTYRCPHELKEIAKPGMLVSAPLKKGIAKGILYRTSSTPPPGNIKEIAEIHGNRPLFSTSMMKLLMWMSDYYIAPAGLILKQTVPHEMLVEVKPKKSSGMPAVTSPYDLFPVPEQDLARCSGILDSAAYQTTLLYAASSQHEISIAASLLRRAGGALVLFPEIIGATRFFSTMRDLGEKACILHSDMAAGKRSEAMKGIVSGKHDLVIGTRTALFAPILKPHLIIIMHEQAGSYKLEDGIRYNVRDCAIMRGFLERIPVLMTSSAPSMESWANALSGKYRLLDMHSGRKIPKVRTVDMHFTQKVRPYLSSSVIAAAKRALQRNDKVLFLMNRRGHSTMLHCAECGAAERCTECGIPLVLHKEENLMRCHYCGRNVAIPETCNTCKSSRLELLGAGTQKIEEDMRELFGVITVRFDSDKAARKTAVRDMLARASQDETRILVGTKMLTSLLRGAAPFGMAAMLNTDISLNIPDFRAREKAFQEIVAVRDLVSPPGELLLQTRLSHEPLFRHIKNNDFQAFATEELSLRRDLRFPPYAKMMDIVVSHDGDLPEKAVRLIGLSSMEIEILGPTERKTRKGKIEYSILIRHPERKLLHTAVRSLLAKIGKISDAEIRVDVDPY